MHIFFAMQIYIFFRSSDTFLSNRPKAIINAQPSRLPLFFQPLAYPIPSLPVPPPAPSLPSTHTEPSTNLPPTHTPPPFSLLPRLYFRPSRPRFLFIS